jgi:hypothetical protein
MLNVLLKCRFITKTKRQTKSSNQTRKLFTSNIRLIILGTKNQGAIAGYSFWKGQLL